MIKNTYFFDFFILKMFELWVLSLLIVLCFCVWRQCCPKMPSVVSYHSSFFESQKKKYQNEMAISGKEMPKQPMSFGVWKDRGIKCVCWNVFIICVYCLKNDTSGHTVSVYQFSFWDIKFLLENPCFCFQIRTLSFVVFLSFRCQNVFSQTNKELFVRNNTILHWLKTVDKKKSMVFCVVEVTWKWKFTIEKGILGNVFWKDYTQFDCFFFVDFMIWHYKCDLGFLCSLNEKYVCQKNSFIQT